MVAVAVAARHLQQCERRVDEPPFFFAHVVVVVGGMAAGAVTVRAVDIVGFRPPPAEALERGGGRRPSPLLGLLELGRGERRGGAGDGDGCALRWRDCQAR